jgi:hypothetical protein
VAAERVSVGRRLLVAAGPPVEVESRLHRHASGAKSAAKKRSEYAELPAGRTP